MPKIRKGRIYFSFINVMRVLDVFSWLPVKELSTEQIEDIFLMSYDGVVNDTYLVVHEMPENAENNIIECQKDMLNEGKQVAYIVRDNLIVALVAYKK